MTTVLFDAAGALGSIIGKGVLAGVLAFFFSLAVLHAYEWGVRAWGRAMAWCDAAVDWADDE